MMTSLILSSLALAAAPAPPPAAAVPRGYEVEVRFGSKDYDLDELPPEVPESTRESIDFYASWAEEREYRMEVYDEGRAMILLPRHDRTPKSQRRLIAQTLELFDEVLPLPERRRAAAGDAPRNNAMSAGDGDEDAPDEWSWGIPELGTQTATLFQLRSVEDYETLIDHLAASNEYLADWARAGKRQYGFVLQQPLAAAWVLNAPTQEEWSADHELVNRLAQLLMWRRFGKQPFWLRMGIAWYAEIALHDDVYCFPYRDGFVSVSEHGGWDKALRSDFKGRDAAPFALAAVAGWKRGSYDDRLARRAWGVVHFLSGEHPGALSEILEDLRLRADADGRLTHSDGTWELIPGYEVPPATQLEIFREHAGEEFEAEVTEYFEDGLKGR